jgi:predicted metallopeptidase
MGATYKNLGNSLEPIAADLFKSQPVRLEVSPDKIIFASTTEKRNAFAYTKMITGVTKLLTDSEFFIVLVEEHWNKLKDEEKRWVLLHEMYHCIYSKTGEPTLRKHDVEDFEILLKDPQWNLDLIKPKKQKPDLV